MRKFFVAKIIAVLLVIVTMTSCNAVKLQIPEAKKPILESYVWANDAHSSYYYDRLEDDLKEPYEKIVEACLSLTEKVSIVRVDENELSDIIRAVMRDYPGIDWLDGTYSFARSLDGKTVVQLEYTKDKQQVDHELKQLNISTIKFLAEISPELSDYEKALIVHDKLVNTITYDLQASNQRTVYGAVVESLATCEGYAKAYQFLLLKMNIEAIVVYGMVDEAHAWNTVQLGGDYYNVDVTFDDRDLTNGGSYLSREYLFVTDEQLQKTHALSIEGVNDTLPQSTSTYYNYFVQNGSYIETSNSSEVKRVAKQMALQAVNNRDESFQIRFSSDAIADTISKTMFENGVLDQAVHTEVSRYQSVKYTGRTYEAATNVLTFLLEYQS